MGGFVGEPAGTIFQGVFLESTDGDPHHGELLTPLKATSHSSQAQGLGLG